MSLIQIENRNTPATLDVRQIAPRCVKTRTERRSHDSQASFSK